MIAHAIAFRDMDRAGDGAAVVLLRWLLAGYVILLPVQLETPFDIRFAPSDLFLILALPLGLRVWRLGGLAWSGWLPALLGVFAIWTAARLFLTGSVSQYVLVNKLGGITLLAASYIALTSVATAWGDVRAFARVFVMSVTLQNLVNSAAFLWCRSTGDTRPEFDFLLSGGYDRLAGMLVDPNAYGGVLTVAYALVLLDGDGPERMFSPPVRLASLLSLALGLLLTSSRSAWIGFAVLTLFGAARSARLLALIAVSGVVGVAAAAYLAGGEEFDSFLTVTARQNTIDERIELSENALRMFIANPAFGGGLGAFAEEHSQIVHNTALWFLAEFGLVGLVAFTGFALAFLAKGITAYRLTRSDCRALVAGLLAAHLAMIGFSLGVEALYQRSWWMVMALVGSAFALARRDAAALGNTEDEALPLERRLPCQTC